MGFENSVAAAVSRTSQISVSLTMNSNFAASLTIVPQPLPDVNSSFQKRKWTIKAFHYALFKQVEDYLRLGWMVSIPNGTSHHHYYGIELMWICDCHMVVPVREKNK